MQSSMIPFLRPASKPTTKILAKVAEWVEEHKFLTNWEAIEHDGWRHPSIKEKYDWCGTWQTLGCLNKNIHEMLGCGRGIYIRQYQRSCYRPSCKECYLKWIARGANRATRRIESYAEKIGKKLIHLMLMVPPSQNNLPYKLLKKRMLEIAKMAGWEGGAVIFHPFKFNKRLREFYYSPHFHLVGFGSKDKISKAFGRFGWYVKPKEERISVFQTFCYLLSHCGIRKGHHAVTWIGGLSYSKVPSEKEPKNDCCPVCWCLLVPIYCDIIDPRVPPDQYFEGLLDDDGNWKPVRTSYRTRLEQWELDLNEELYLVYDILNQPEKIEPVLNVEICHVCNKKLSSGKFDSFQKFLFSTPPETLTMNLYDGTRKKACPSCHAVAIECMAVYSKRNRRFDQICD